MITKFDWNKQITEDDMLGLKRSMEISVKRALRGDMSLGLYAPVDAATYSCPATPQLMSLIPVEAKHDCAYCHGTTRDDYLGNCAACGAPRQK